MKKITLITSLFLLVCSLTFGQAARKAVIEEFTGDWCGYCPDGASVLEQINDDNPGQVIPLGMHYGDDWQFSYSTAIASALSVSSYPSAAFDRKPYSGKMMVSRGQWASVVSTRLNESAPCEIGITSNFNASTRKINAQVNVHFVAAETGDMRITCLLIEDSISSNQSNYYNGTTGSEWYGKGNPIVGYMQRNVVRGILSTASFGDAGVIPASAAAGAYYTKSYSYTLPNDWDEKHIKIVAFVDKYSTDVNSMPILNAEIAGLSETVSAQTVGGVDETTVSAQPNPFNNFAFVNVNVAKFNNVKVSVIDMLGREINVLCNENLTAGMHNFVWGGTDAMANMVAPGNYFIRVQSGDAISTVKVIKQ